eukprot:gene8161-1458_t
MREHHNSMIVAFLLSAAPYYGQGQGVVAADPPCTWPSRPPAPVPFPQSDLLKGVKLLENATAIPNYGADTWYPAEGLDGSLYSGFDDGTVDGVNVGSACTRPPPHCLTQGFTTGSAVVTGESWRDLSVNQVGGPIHEIGLPMQGRYTCANAYANGTWWVGTYGTASTLHAGGLYTGLAVGDASCEAGTGVLQFCEMGPFVGFRHSLDGGHTWQEPQDPQGRELNVSNPLFPEPSGQPIKLGAPHVVDFGPENRDAPDGRLYMVGNGCLADKLNSNCSWISGDAVFLSRTTSGPVSADPGWLNDLSHWEFFCGSGTTETAPCWTSDVTNAKPILTWKGRVGTVTATWHSGLSRFLIAVTTPTILPSTVGPYDTWILETPSLE